MIIKELFYFLFCVDLTFFDFSELAFGGLMCLFWGSIDMWLVLPFGLYLKEISKTVRKSASNIKDHLPCISVSDSLSDMVMKFAVRERWVSIEISEIDRPRVEAFIPSTVVDDVDVLACCFEAAIDTSALCLPFPV